MITETMKPRGGIGRGGPNRFVTFLFLAVFGIGSMYYIYSSHTELSERNEVIIRVQRHAEDLASQMKLLKDNKERMETDMNSEIQKLKKTQRELENKIEKDKSTFEGEKQDLIDEKNAIQEELQEARNKYNELKQDCDDVSRQHAQVAQENERLLQEAEEMKDRQKKQLDEADLIYKHEADRLRTENEELKTKLKELEKHKKKEAVDEQVPSPAPPHAASRKSAVPAVKPQVLAEPPKAELSSSTKKPQLSKQRKNDEVVEAQQGAVLPLPPANKGDSKGAVEPNQMAGPLSSSKAPFPNQRFFPDNVAAQLHPQGPRQRGVAPPPPVAAPNLNQVIPTVEAHPWLEKTKDDPRDVERRFHDLTDSIRQRQKLHVQRAATKLTELVKKNIETMGQKDVERRMKEPWMEEAEPWKRWRPFGPGPGNAIPVRLNHIYDQKHLDHNAPGGGALQQGEEGDYGEDQGEREDEKGLGLGKGLHLGDSPGNNQIQRSHQLPKVDAGKHFNDFEDTLVGDNDKQYDMGNADGQEGDDELNYQQQHDARAQQKQVDGMFGNRVGRPGMLEQAFLHRQRGL
ncbi:unnamed protein product [Cyprideis torosa]|uniref:Uncharacterized protein n=1 Tax=Cyprideis torosa TaxID=163714 RepID=A0A7R8WPV3_9CRUS|nr:unnamed protein product [Cyprideis torosa]CAG0901180.1 unnamed protein product [Cyprideis torosa]